MACVIRPKQVNCAMTRGIFFEVSYAPAIADNTSRRNVFSNAIQVARASRFKHIILSSAASRPMLLRGYHPLSIIALSSFFTSWSSHNIIKSPYDVANLSRLFGLDAGAAKLTVSDNPRAALIRGRMRRDVAKSAVSVVKLSELDQESAWQLEGDVRSGGSGTTAEHAADEEEDDDNEDDDAQMNDP